MDVSRAEEVGGYVQEPSGVPEAPGLMTEHRPAPAVVMDQRGNYWRLFPKGTLPGADEDMWSACPTGGGNYNSEPVEIYWPARIQVAASNISAEPPCACWPTGGPPCPTHGTIRVSAHCEHGVWTHDDSGDVECCVCSQAPCGGVTVADMVRHRWWDMDRWLRPASGEEAPF